MWFSNTQVQKHRACQASTMQYVPSPSVKDILTPSLLATAPPTAFQWSCLWLSDVTPAISVTKLPNISPRCNYAYQRTLQAVQSTSYYDNIQGDSFGTRPKKMRISQRLFIRFWTCIYDYIPCFMKSMSILEDMPEIFATTVQAVLNATLHVSETGLQDVLTNRSNFTSNVVFQCLYGAWLVGISFSF